MWFLWFVQPKFQENSLFWMISKQVFSHRLVLKQQHRRRIVRALYSKENLEGFSICHYSATVYEMSILKTRWSKILSFIYFPVFLFRFPDNLPRPWVYKVLFVIARKLTYWLRCSWWREDGRTFVVTKMASWIWFSRFFSHPIVHSGSWKPC